VTFVLTPFDESAFTAFSPSLINGILITMLGAI
jgi:hypothetical protein